MAVLIRCWVSDARRGTEQRLHVGHIVYWLLFNPQKVEQLYGFVKISAAMHLKAEIGSDAWMDARATVEPPLHTVR